MVSSRSQPGECQAQGCLFLPGLPHLSRPQFPLLSNRHNYSTYETGLLRGFNKAICEHSYQQR